MAQLVLLVVAAAWAAVLIPPMLRSRVDNRPNSSVTDFRRQLSTLQSTSNPRVRSIGRPLAPSPLHRPAAAGRPGHPHHRQAALHGSTATGPRSSGTRQTERAGQATFRTHGGGEPAHRQTHMERPTSSPSRTAPRVVPTRRHDRVHAVPRCDHLVDGAVVRVRLVVPRIVRIRVSPRSTASARSLGMGRRLARAPLSGPTIRGADRWGSPLHSSEPLGL
jgi:hypothetical protein